MHLPISTEMYMYNNTVRYDHYTHQCNSPASQGAMEQITALISLAEGHTCYVVLVIATPVAYLYV